MISALYAKELKGSLLPTGIIAAVLAMYTVMIIQLFDPESAEALDAMMRTMPGIFDAFGMGNATTTLLGFILNYLYGFLYTLFPLVLILLLVNRLIIRPIDQGSMAWLIASPHRRIAIISTLTSVLLTVLVALMAVLTALELGTSAIAFPDEEVVVGLTRVNLGLFALWICMAGLCLLSACVFRSAAPALWIGGGFAVLEFVVQMVAQTGERFEDAKYATFLTLFDRYGLADGKADAAWSAVALAAAGAVMIGIAMVAFVRRDLDV